MIEAGCQFGPDDLAWDEWEGLIELSRAQYELSREK